MLDSTFAAFLGISLIYLSALFCWPNRKNLIFWINFPLFIVAYCLPLYFYGDQFKHQFLEYEKYCLIVMCGGLSFFLGCMLGKYLPLLKMRICPLSETLNSDELRRRNIKVCFFLLTVSCVFLIISFLKMGFIPMFAEDPLSAKFFRGAYKEKYESVALIYRLGTTIIPLIIPISIVYLLSKQNWPLAIITIITIVLMALTLQRGPVGLSVFTGLLIFSFYRSRLLSYMGLGFYFIAYSFGSAVIWLLGLAPTGTSGILSGIMAGAPDLTDQLSFLGAFQKNPELTYGKTFWGGLIPGGYQWNPAVYTLSILNQTKDISQVASGGFRLLSPLWGYVSFGYIGVVLVPFVSGVFTAIQVRLLKRKRSDAISFVMAYVYFKVVFGFLVNYFVMSMYAVPVMILAFYLYYINGSRINFRNTSNLHAKATI